MIAAGTIALLFAFDLPAQIREFSEIAVAGMALLIVVSLWCCGAARRSSAGGCPGARGAVRIRASSKLRVLEHDIYSFASRRPARWFPAILLELGFHALGVLETHLTLWMLLGTAAALLTSFIFETAQPPDDRRVQGCPVPARAWRKSAWPRSPPHRDRPKHRRRVLPHPQGADGRLGTGRRAACSSDPGSSPAHPSDVLSIAVALTDAAYAGREPASRTLTPSVSGGRRRSRETAGPSDRVQRLESSSIFAQDSRSCVSSVYVRHRQGCRHPRRRQWRPIQEPTPRSPNCYTPSLGSRSSCARSRRRRRPA